MRNKIIDCARADHFIDAIPGRNTKGKTAKDKSPLSFTVM